jgi:pyruvate dehydrogenase E2 component (dihydrolipoamide acetyltransferase)
VLRAVDALSTQQLSVDMRALIERARSGGLTRTDLSGGAITVSNLGMLGIDQFTAIITPPQCSILAMGRATQQMIVNDGVASIATVMNCTMSCDHRVIDGAVGASFLEALRRRVESEPGALD